jgi:hypothetical protein
MSTIHPVLFPLERIQPSQLYINAAKLSIVLSRYNSKTLQEEKFPVLELNEQWVFSDQHTRALAAYLFGIDQIWIYPDPDDLTLDMYRICVGWCQSEYITSIRDLAQRVIDDQAYQVQWVDRCHQMHQQFSD